MNIEIKVDYIEKDDAGNLIITKPKKFHKDAKHIQSIFDIERKRFGDCAKYSLCISNKSISPQLNETNDDPQLVPKLDVIAEIFNYIEQDMATVDEYVKHIEKGEVDKARNLNKENAGRISKLQSIRSKLNSESLELTHENGKKIVILPSPKLEQNTGKDVESKWLYCSINTPEFIKSRSAIFKTTNERKNLVANLAITDLKIWDDVIEYGKKGILIDITLRYKEPHTNATNITGELVSIKKSASIEQEELF